MENEKPETIEIVLPNGQTVGEKPKRKYKPREKKDSSNSVKSNSKKSPIGENEISSLLIGVFSLISLKAGSHWEIDEAEAKSISTPLASILEKLNIVEEVAKVSDGAMLVLACGMILIPRIMISTELNKSKKKPKVKIEEVRSNNEKEGHTSEIHSPVDGGNNENQQSDGGNVKTLLNSNITNI